MQLKSSKAAWGISALVVLAFVSSPSLFAAAPNPEVEKLKAQVAALSDTLKIMEDSAKAPQKSTADTALDSKYGPNQSVTTAKGKLQIGGLVQVWYTQFQHDTRGYFDIPGQINDTNTASDNDSFRIRRTELRFNVDIHENVSAYAMIDPAAEAASYPQGAVGRKSLAYVAPQFYPFQANNNGPFNGGVPGSTTLNVANTQLGLRTPNPTLLQDALINFHCIVPHHDFTVGQMRNTFNEENFGENGSLDFVERAYIGNSVSRDIGAVIHGSWWCNGGGGAYQGSGDSGRFQYWLGVWNGTANLLGTGGTSYNRSDDNSHKDFVGTMLLRPIWDDCYGKLELGYSFRAGHHGNSGETQENFNDPNFGGKNTSSIGHDAWAKYYAPRCFKGLWFKGEATWLRDRNAPGSVINIANGDFQLGGNGDGTAAQAQPLSTFGYWGAIGYRLSDSALLANCNGSFWRGFEVDFRFEKAPNIFVAKPNENFTSVYSTAVYTAGVNYYIKGDNAKIQLNYNKIQNPSGPNAQPFHNVKNDSLELNFQVMW